MFKNKHVLSGIYGGSATTFVLFLIAFIFALSLSIPLDAKSFYFILFILKASPFVWLLFFTYFFLTSFKRTHKKGFYFTLQMAWSVPLSALMAVFFLGGHSLSFAFLSGGLLFLYFGAAVISGIWACSKIA